MDPRSPLQIAVIGSGAAGLSAAWLLAQPGHTRARLGSPEPIHQITLMEKDDRLGGHAHTATLNCHKNKHRANQSGLDGEIGVDTGFIVYNTLNYPNFTAWLDKLQVASQPTEMSFAVSLDGGDYEYKGGDLTGLFAQPSNIIKPRFWRMLSDLVRFYRAASGNSLPSSHITLGDYLEQGTYGPEFVNDHLLPFGAAIWSTSQEKMLDYPAAAFIRFCDNHGLLSLADRPEWRSVTGGSKSYVEAVKAELQDHTIITSHKATKIYRTDAGVVVEDRSGNQSLFDHVVMATHADQTLDLLVDADELETRLLSPFTYDQNLVLLHTDTRLLPRRKRAWASWNYLQSAGTTQDQKSSVSYWMNCLQSLPTDTNYVVSLNPTLLPDSDSILRTSIYEHPIFTAETYQAQQELWSLQGRRNTWFCGAWFGAGFHEDAIQSGLAVAEQLGGGKRPWSVNNESGRIFLGDSAPASLSERVA